MGTAGEWKNVQIGIKSNAWVYRKVGKMCECVFGQNKKWKT